MKKMITILLFPVVAAGGFYLGSYIFPNLEKIEEDSISQEEDSDKEETKAQEVTSPKINNSSSSKPVVQNNNTPLSGGKSKPINDAQIEHAIKENKALDHEVQLLRSQITKLNSAISKLKAHQKSHLAKMAKEQKQRIVQFPALIKKAEINGYEQGKIETSKLLRQK